MAGSNRVRRLILGGAIALITTGTLTSCGAVQTGSCLDYVSLPTPVERFDGASVVVVADVTSTDRTVEQSGRYQVHRARVVEVLKGKLSDREFDVINPSDQCTTSGRDVEYSQGDVLADDARLILYLAVQEADAPARRLVIPGAADPVTVESSLPTDGDTP